MREQQRRHQVTLLALPKLVNGEIFRRTIGYSLILTAAVGIVAMIEVYLIPGIIPTLS